MLFLGGQAVGVCEAKPAGFPVRSVEFYRPETLRESLTAGTLHAWLERSAASIPPRGRHEAVDPARADEGIRPRIGIRRRPTVGSYLPGWRDVRS